MNTNIKTDNFLKKYYTKNSNPLISFEFFPPKDGETDDLFSTISALSAFNPEFVSITYGAMGSTQIKSLEIIKQIKAKFQNEILAHFTCIGTSKEEVAKFIETLLASDIKNILALRGDIPKGLEKKDIVKDFNYATDLIADIRKNYPKVVIAAAAYPEGHPETSDRKQDLYYLKDKVDAGADLLITQLFFDNRKFYDFYEAALKININVPILPGLMPLSSYKTIEKITQMTNVSIPKEIFSFFENNENKDDQIKYAIDFISNQCFDLMNNGINCFHFYTLNKSRIIYEVCKTLK